MNWYVEITGDQSDLSMLSDALTSSEASLAFEDGKYVLNSTRFAGLSSAREVADVARHLLAEISGSARVLLGARSPLIAGGVYLVREDGKRDYFLLADGATLNFRAFPPTITIGHPDGSMEVHRPADPIRKLVEAAANDAALAKAMRLRDNDELDWTHLYRLFEVIQHSVGQGQIVTNGWATKSDMRRFKHTANSVGAIGDRSRHGVEDTDPPQHPMSIDDARELIDRLLTSWLRARAS